MGYTEEQNRVMEHSSSSSTTTEEDSAVHYEEREVGQNRQLSKDLTYWI